GWRARRFEGRARLGSGWWAPPGGRVLERRLDRADHRVHPPRVRSGAQRRFGGSRSCRPFGSDGCRAEPGILKTASQAMPRGRKGAATPAGLVLYDKPAGPSSFAIVRQLREQTGARAGHAGTLDPFATGLLL